MALQYLSPCYFTVEFTRAQGRRGAKDFAVPSPTIAQVARAAKQCGFTVLDEERDVAHPAYWFSREGRLRVEHEGSKEELLKKVAHKLSGK